jgi:hypothetical protein
MGLLDSIHNNECEEYNIVDTLECISEDFSIKVYNKNKGKFEIKFCNNFDRSFRDYYFRSNIFRGYNFSKTDYFILFLIYSDFLRVGVVI